VICKFVSGNRVVACTKKISGVGRPLAGACRFVADTRASTAVEFAIVGGAFFLFIFSIFVFSLDQFLQTTLDDAVRTAARQVQLGKITTGNAFVTTVCNEFGAVAPNCAGSLQYAVQSGAYFGTGGIVAATFSASGNLSTPAAFTGVTATAAGAPAFLLVQVAYPLPFIVLAVPSGVATENGTSSLYSAVSTEMEP
jgi:Flp pilus assembly protein TadG